MPKSFFYLVPKLLQGPIYCDVSRDEIERYLIEDGKFDQVFEVNVEQDENVSVAVCIRVIVQLKAQWYSVSVLLHDVRIAGIDFEGKFTDRNGLPRHGWHKHIWDARVENSKKLKESIAGFEELPNAAEFLIRAFKELKISLSGKDYGNPKLQLD
jgi:hypothetical protein